MPTLAVARDFLFKLMGKSYSDEQFEDLCFEFGIELDDVTSEQEMMKREQGAAATKLGSALSDEVLYKIDTPANRYDLLSAEGMALALKVFTGQMATPTFTALHRANPVYKMVVEKSVRNVRDYVVCAVLKNVQWTHQGYLSFISLQEKLHSGLGRRRTLSSVGTHDLDKINATEFIYTALPKEKISFSPLNCNGRVLNCAGNGLTEFYANDRNISKFVPLISSLPNYPVIMDASRQNILSLPPVINSDFSKISPETKNIFIECTAPDHYKASVFVNQIVCAFSAYCAEPFTVESVAVEYEEAAPDGTKKIVTPDLSARTMSANLDYLNSRIGVNIETTRECVALLDRMMCKGVASADDKTITVEVPPCRSDIIHSCDLIEDVAVAYGYDKIRRVPCRTMGAVTQTKVSKTAHLLRLEVANAGYTELLTFSLCSREDAFESLGRVDDNIAVHIANPQTLEFQVCRPYLMPGMLKTLNGNKSQPLPLRFFEISDVVKMDTPENFPPILNVPGAPEYSKSGARNERHLAALHCASEGGSFEAIHGLLNYVMVKLDVPLQSSVIAHITEQQATGVAHTSADEIDCYSLQEGVDGAFFPGRSVDVLLHRRGEVVRIGHLGVVHPNTLKAYDIPFPCAYLELNIQPFCY